MKTRTITMREKIIASAASAALAASMVVCVPGMAFATIDAENSSITATTTDTVVVKPGSQVNLSSYFVTNAVSADGKYHVDYKVTSGTGASVNKHSGVLTATTAGNVIITAYLTGIEQPQGNKNNPCSATTVSDSLNVEVSDEHVYGYQGAGNTIKMTDPDVTSFSGNNANGWANTLAASTPSDGLYTFTLSMSNGFKDYDNAAGFASINAGNIVLKDKNGNTIDALAANNGSGVYIESVSNATKTVVVSVEEKLVTKGETYLEFENGFRGNSATKTLGTTISFAIQ